MQKLKKGDPIKIIAGKFKGQISKISKHLGNSAIIEGINISKRSKKGKGIIDIAKPIHISNISYYSEKNNGTSKISFVIDGVKKQRKLVKFDQIID